MKTTSKLARAFGVLLSVAGLLLVQMVALPVPAGAVGEPGPFSKTGPANGATGQPLTVSLSWSASSGDPVPGYYYCFDTTNDGSCTGWWAASSGVVIGPLSPGTTYYWQVAAINSQGTTYADGGATAFWQFTTGSAFPPGAFGKTGPGNGATGQPLSVTLSWGSSSGAPTPTYRYCLDTTNDGACSYWTFTSATSAVIGPLSPSTTYYWQVFATNSQGTTYADGGATAFWQFTTAAAAPPGAFGKIGPLNGAVGQPLSVTLSWSASAGLPTPPTGRYFYCYDTTNDGRCDLWAGTTSTSVVIDDLDPNTSYYWQVFAINSQGTTYADGSATAFWKFTTRSASTPVTVQFRSRSAFDGWVLESAEQSGRGGALNSWGRDCLVGDDAGDRQSRSILHFATRSLPDDAVITNATLQIRSAGFTGSSPFLTHGALTVDIRRGGFHGATPLEFADFQARANRLAVGTFGSSPAGGWYTARLAASGYQFVNRQGATQLRLRFALDDNDDGGPDYLSFVCGDTNVVADRPVLTVTYYVP
jgi:FlaG/FlaF family flagellin (archaellin)